MQKICNKKGYFWVNILTSWVSPDLLQSVANICSQKSTFQHQFVKTPFPCIWSNRDMSLFSFWPISPQFCIVKSTKASEKWSHMGEGLWGPLFHALGMVFILFGSFLRFFCNEKAFSKAFLQHFLHFQFIKTPSHCKKVANSMGRCFDKL